MQISALRFVLLMAPLAVAAAVAQDTRAVSEPKIPPVCAVLQAQLTGQSDGTIVQGEMHPDTERIQNALDGCEPGHAVELVLPKFGPMVARNPGYNAFLSGPLELRNGVTLVVDKGVTLYASRNPAEYEIFQPEAGRGARGLCGTSMPRPAQFPTFSVNQAARPKGGCRALITADHVQNAGVMGEGTIDGRGYAKLTGKDYSWWQMARRAQPHDDLYFAARLISADYADGFTLYGIHLNNSMNYHVGVSHTNGFTAWGVHLQTPTNKKLIGTENDARNTDGIDPGTSTNVTVIHSWIDNGDDNIAIKQGVSHMSVIDNHFYSGHGMSIGSETVLGQSFLLVDGLTEDHTASGIRIKSNVMRGGPVHDLVYRNVCMRDVPIPIAISPYYTNQTVEPFEDPKYKGDKIPDYKRITLDHVFSETPGDVLIAGLDAAHRTEVTLESVHVEGVKPAQVHMKYVELHEPVCQADHLAPRTNIDPPEPAPTVKRDGLQAPGCGGYAMHPADPCAGKFLPYR